MFFGLRWLDIFKSLRKVTSQDKLNSLSATLFTTIVFGISLFATFVIDNGKNHFVRNDVMRFVKRIIEIIL